MKKVTKSLCPIFFICVLGMLIIHFSVQMIWDIQDFRELSMEQFLRIERIFAERAAQQEQRKDDFGEDTVGELFFMISTDEDAAFYLADAESKKILGTTDERRIGGNLEDLGLRQTGGENELWWGTVTAEEKAYFAARTNETMILVKTSPVCLVHWGAIKNTLLLFGYFIALFLILFLTSDLFFESKRIRSRIREKKKRKAAVHGEWYMVLEEAPIGICEYIPALNRLTATKRVKDILMLTDEEFDEYMEYPQLFVRKKKELCREEARFADNIYCCGEPGETERYIRVETFEYNDSKMTIFMDVTAELKEKQRIEKERDTDPLTGLYNRRAFYRYIEALFASPEQMKIAVMIMVDLDHLKLVNDTYGHASGDSYLHAFADFLHQLGDKGKLSARMGGDEFVTFAYGYESREEAKHVVEQLSDFRDSHRVVMENGEEIMLEYSVGRAFYPEEGIDYETLIRLADKRMYEEKNERKRVRISRAGSPF